MQVGVVTLPWFLQHEWRLWCREQKQYQSLLILALLIIPVFYGSIIGLAMFVRPLRMNLQGLQQQLAQSPELGFWIAVGAWVCLLLIGLYDSLTRLLNFLSQPTSMELLASSPVEAQMHLAVQLYKLAFNLLLGYGYLLGAVPGIVFLARSWQPVGGFVIATIHATLLSISLATGLVLFLVRWLGLQKANTVIRLSFTVPGLFLFMGLVSLRSPIGWPTFTREQLLQFFQQYIASNMWWGQESWLWFPARASLLEPQAIVLMTLLSGGLVWLTYKQLPTAFMKAIQQPHIQREQSLNGSQAKFISGVTPNIIVKEWRLIWRRNQLWQLCWGWIICTVFIWPNWILSPTTIHQFPTQAGKVTMLTVFMGASLASGLLGHFVAGEDLHWFPSVPVSSRQLQVSKLLAALGPVWVLLLPAIALVQFLGGSGSITLLLLLIASTHQAVMRWWHSCSVNLRTMDRGKVSLYRDIKILCFELLTLFLWAACGALLQSSWWMYGILVLLLEAGILRWAYLSNRRLRTSLTHN